MIELTALANLLYAQTNDYQEDLSSIEYLIMQDEDPVQRERAYKALECCLRDYGARTPTSEYLLKQLATAENRDIITTGNLLHLGNCKSQSPSMPHSEGATDDMASKHRELYTYTDAQGNDCTVRLNGQSKQDTDRKFQELLQGVSPVAAIPSKTLHEFVMEDYRPTFLTGLKATTQSNYTIYEDNYILPCMGDKPLRAINNKDVQEMMDWMANGKQNGLRQDIVHDSIERVKGHLHTLLEYAKDMDYIKENPIKDKLLRNNGKPSGHHTALSPDEYAEVRRNALTLSNRSQRLYACLLVYTGMRPEEIRGMKWELVNLEKGYCIVQEVVTYDTRTKATIVSPTPKTEASARTILLPPPVVEAMRKEIRPCGYVIGAGRDPLTPLPYSTFKRLYTDTFKKLGLNGKCDNYDFRASYATWLKESGVELAHAADLMGQADTRMMSRVYAPTRHESIIMHQERISSLVESQLVAPS